VQNPWQNPNCKIPVAVAKSYFLAKRSVARFSFEQSSVGLHRLFTGCRRGQRALAQISIKNVTILEPKILLWIV
jgi:hypothetical protein